MKWRRLKIAVKYGPESIRRDAIESVCCVALEHLGLPAHCSVASTRSDRRRGYLVAITARIEVPAAEQLAMQGYLRRKIRESTGLDLPVKTFMVHFRQAGLSLPMAHDAISSQWLASRLRQLRGEAAADPTPESAAQATPAPASATGTTADAAATGGEIAYVRGVSPRERVQAARQATLQRRAARAIVPLTAYAGMDRHDHTEFPSTLLRDTEGF